jgi:hypothetical protein
VTKNSYVTFISLNCLQTNNQCQWRLYFGKRNLSLSLSLLIYIPIYTYIIGLEQEWRENKSKIKRSRICYPVRPGKIQNTYLWSYNTYWAGKSPNRRLKRVPDPRPCTSLAKTKSSIYVFQTVEFSSPCVAVKVEQISIRSNESQVQIPFLNHFFHKITTKI